MTSRDYEHVRYEKEGRIAHIVLDRPEVLNAMNIRMHEELAEIWDDFEADDNIWVGIISGAGERAFSVGQDLKELAGRINAGSNAYSSFGSKGKPGWPRLTDRFDISKPLIAKVRGYALGGGMEVALACDLIVASEGAVLGLTEARVGLIAGAGGVFRMTRQAPFRAAMGYLLTGRQLTAQRAYELGIINEVAREEDLDDVVDEWARDILRCAPLSVRAIKQAAARSSSMTLEDAFSGSYDWEERRARSDDALEGARAFSEKRPPHWTGR